MFIIFKNKKSKFFNIITTILFLVYLNFLDKLRTATFDQNYIKIKEFENSYEKSFLENLFFENKISEMKKFREINCNDILLDNKDLISNKNPDVSVIITLYNQANCFVSSLRSVQNQSLKNIKNLQMITLAK